MSNQYNGELRNIEELVTGGSYDRALEALEELLEQENLSATSRTACWLLKSQVLVKKGRFEEAIVLAGQARQESQQAGQDLQVVDACIILFEASWRLDKLDKAIEYAKEGEKRLVTVTGSDIEREKRKGKLLRLKGIILDSKGDLDRALNYYQRSLGIAEKTGNEQEMADSLDNIGIVYLKNGDLDQALDCYQRSLENWEKTGNEQEMADSLNNIGVICRLKGDLDQALDYHRQSLEINEKIGNEQSLALSIGDIGMVYWQKGDLDRALDCLQQCLGIFEKTDKDYYTSGALLFLIEITIDQDDLVLARRYMEQLRAINDRQENKFINSCYRIASALLLKTSKRARNVGEAIKILEQVVKEETVDHTLTVDAMLHLCDLLLYELRTSGEEEILGEIKQLTEQLHGIARQQNSHSLVAETYLLQSKLALLELDARRARELLNQAHLKASEKGLGKLTRTIARERDLLVLQADKWERIFAQQPSMGELADLIHLDDLFARMIHKKVYLEEEKAFQYAEKAKKLLETWEKES